MNNDPAEKSIAVYNDRQKEILRGELVGLIAFAILALGGVIALGVAANAARSVTGEKFRAEYNYDYAGVRQITYAEYLQKNNIKPVAPDAADIVAYTAWVAANPRTVNVQVLQQYLGNTYNETAVVYAHMTRMASQLGVSCSYCHNTANFGEDSKPQKVTARAMQLMQFETQKKWIDTIPHPPGQPQYQLQCATCHNGQLNGWNRAGKLANPEAYGAGGGGLPYDFQVADKQLLETRANAQGDVNFFRVTELQRFQRPNAGLDPTARNQAMMYHANVALNVGCDFCHYGGYFPSYTLENGAFLRPKAQARHMIGMVQDLAVNWWPQMPGMQGAALPNCFMCHRGYVVPPGAADPDTFKIGTVANPSIRPLVNLTIPAAVRQQPR